MFQGENRNHGNVIPMSLKGKQISKLNITKNFDNSTTKELQVDLRKSGTPNSPISIKGVDVDIVQVYSNPGVHRTVSFTEQRTPT